MTSSFSQIAREFTRKFAAPIAVVFYGSMIFGLNLLDRSDHNKNSLKLDNTNTQLKHTTTELSTRLDMTGKKIQSINRRLDTMNWQIGIIRGDIRLAQLIAGSAILVKIEDLQKPKTEGEK